MTTEWKQEPGIRRPIVTAQEYIAIAREIAAGQPHPYYRHDLDDVLSDANLAAYNESRHQTERADSAIRSGRRARRAESLVWNLVHATGKRKTMQTASVRAALDSAQEWVDSNAEAPQPVASPERVAEVLTTALTQLDAMTWLGCRRGDRAHDEKIGQRGLAGKLSEALLAAGMLR